MLSTQGPSYVFKLSISSPAATVLSHCNWISGKQNIDSQLQFPSPSTILMYAYYSTPSRLCQLNGTMFSTNNQPLQ
jgi:hypothetical protein